MDEWWTEEIFTDEYSDESSEDLDYEDDFFKSTSLTRQFRIILKESDANWLFHVISNLILGDIALLLIYLSEIWNYLERKREDYQAFCKGGIEDYF